MELIIWDLRSRTGKCDMASEKKILIVGLGLIGGSYAQGLSRAGYRVGALVRRQETLDYALEHGFAADGRTLPDRDYVSSFDVIVFALYPRKMLEWLREYGSYIRRGAVVTDVSGVKRYVIDNMRGLLPEGVSFVPAHPMAGKEVYGIENADYRIFRNANFIITPLPGTDPAAVQLVRELAVALEFRRISELTPEKHDEMIGFLSQLTHCIAVALMDCKESSHLVDYTGDSFRDLTRIAKINENMWTELFLENRDELLSQMDLFLEKFSTLRDAIASGDEQTMKEMMITSTRRRAYFEKG